MAERARRRSEIGPFAVLLLALLAPLLAGPFLPESPFGVSRLRLLGGATLLGGLYAVSHHPRTLALGLAIALPGLALEGWMHGRSSGPLVLASAGITISFLLFVGTVVLYRILDEERVTLDTILGGICIYLVIGVVWSIAYSALEHVAPGSFLLEGAPLAAPARADEFRYDELIYFSFVTLTTVGYGDMRAATDPARALAAGEAVVGPLYLAVFIARLVGLHMVHAHRDLDL